MTIRNLLPLVLAGAVMAGCTEDLGKVATGPEESQGGARPSVTKDHLVQLPTADWAQLIRGVRPRDGIQYSAPTGNLVYDTYPSTLPGSFPSWGNEANSTDEFGEYVILGGTDRLLSAVRVNLTNWACENDFTGGPDGPFTASRNGDAPAFDACQTTPGSAFNHPLTLNIYQVGSASLPGTVTLGSLVATKTIVASIPFRPSWDATNCTASGETPTTNAPFGGKWYDPVLGRCVNGYQFSVDFDFSGDNIVLDDGVIVTIAYNTAHHGVTPIGANGPYNSLNLSLTTEGASVGTAVEPDGVMLDTSDGSLYCDGGSGGTDMLRWDYSSGCWGYTPVIQITATTPDEAPPEVTDIIASPNPVPVGSTYHITALVDDGATGGSNIASAVYSLNGGASFAPMGAVDGSFDEVAETVKSGPLTAPGEPGIVNLVVCVKGTDVPGNTSTPTCSNIQLVIYDPTAGFVTGGGWIASPAGAYRRSGDGLVNANPDDGWIFNRDLSSATPADFTAAKASTGLGSLHAAPISASPAGAKFILEYYPTAGTLLSDLEAFSIDFLIDPAGTMFAPSHFYVNLYTKSAGSTAWYDCRYDFVATSGSTAAWTPLGFDNTTSPTAVTRRANAAVTTCPPSYTGMPAGSSYWLAVNLGQSTSSDAGIGGYFDNATLTSSGVSTTWDFEVGLAGRANFGFVSKYKKGATVPDGNTQFTFQTGGLNFTSTSYEWLVVNQNSGNASFKGTGTVNGVGPYKFMLWAGDHPEGDTFRIKIWEEVGGSEVVLYDNGANQLVAGGSIMIHVPGKK